MKKHLLLTSIIAVLLVFLSIDSFSQVSQSAQKTLSPTWSGLVNNDWNTAGNWVDNAVPLSTEDVIIPAGCPNYPIVTTPETCKNATIQSGGMIIINSGPYVGQPCPGIPTVLYEGKTYNTVQIGNQCWFKENLNIGTKISGSTNQTDNSILEKYCYNDDENNCTTYGGLYQWNEAMQYSTTPGVQGICPTGWHLPTDAEWTTLTDFLGGLSIAGGKMKEAGYTHWLSPNTGATNTSGFTALPTGAMWGGGNFSNFNKYTYLWSSSTNDAYDWFKYCRNLDYDANSVNRSDDGCQEQYGFSVRCLQDCNSGPSTPSEGTHVAAPTQIIWNWNPVTCATGYRWNTANDYNTATDLGTAISKTETGLVCNTTYTRYVWAYNAFGHSSSVILSKTTSACTSSCSSITDSRDGKVYSTVLIGTQCWMAQNLNVGTKILGSVDQANNSIIEKYCYNDDENNCTIYGGLYQWDEAMQYSVTPGVQGICPTGWHLPTDAEWTMLTDFLGGLSIAGGKMKEAGYTHWLSPNTGATNTSGFTALPTGAMWGGGNFSNFNKYTYFWSSSTNDAYDVFKYCRNLDYDANSVNRYDDGCQKPFGFSVRCLQDCSNSVPSTPAEGSHSAMSTQIVWNWGAVTGAVGYKWNTTNNYTTATDLMTSLMKNETGLTCNTDYTRYVWAYNSCGSSIVATLTQTTAICVTWDCGQPMTQDGKTYNTVLIGTQCWFAQNLNVGTKVLGSANQTNNSIIEKYCYNNDENYCNIYGGLYQWDEAMQYSTTPGVKGICPTGWHLPTDAEWTTLTTYLGGESIAGGKMKETGTTHWFRHSTYVTNLSGFTALPGGYRTTGGSFDYLTNVAYFWSSSLDDATTAWFLSLYDSGEYVQRANYIKPHGFSARCLKN